MFTRSSQYFVGSGTVLPGKERPLKAEPSYSLTNHQVREDTTHWGSWDSMCHGYDSLWQAVRYVSSESIALVRRESDSFRSLRPCQVPRFARPSERMLT